MWSQCEFANLFIGFILCITGVLYGLGLFVVNDNYNVMYYSTSNRNFQTGQSGNVATIKGLISRIMKVYPDRRCYFT